MSFASKDWKPIRDTVAADDDNGKTMTQHICMDLYM